MPETDVGSGTRKSGLHGCLIALIVILSVVVIAGAVVAWLFLRSPKGKQTIEFARVSAQMMARAGRAPGTAELRKTLCGRGALVLDLDEWRKLQLIPQSPQGPSPARDQVICVPEEKKPVPACGDVARTWLTAVGKPRGDFEVIVKGAMAKELECAKLYSSAGEELGEARVGR
jgi:type II secretory pathway pseudopilin PulG